MFLLEPCLHIVAFLEASDILCSISGKLYIFYSLSNRDKATVHVISFVGRRAWRVLETTWWTTWKYYCGEYLWAILITRHYNGCLSLESWDKGHQVASNKEECRKYKINAATLCATKGGTTGMVIMMNGVLVWISQEWTFFQIKNNNIFLVLDILSKSIQMLVGCRAVW